MRILLYDIETSPIISYNWGIWEQNAIEVIDDFQILTVAWKWLDEKRVHVVGQDDLKGYKPGVNNDLEVVKALHKLFDEADVVVAHNGDQFDQKVSQARMMVHGMNPPAPYKQIDTKKVAKKYGRFTSNKLDDLGKGIGLGQKLDTGGFKIWKGCLAGEKKSWAKMKKYNKQDVVLLEQLYLHLRPWISNHPSVALANGLAEACPKCGKGPMRPHKKRKLANTTWKMQYQCENCGGYSTRRFNEKSTVHYVN